MTFLVIEPDKLMWPGKFGLIANAEEGKLISISDLKKISDRSEQLYIVPSGRQSEGPTMIFSSESNLGRIEVVLQHGCLWPLNPPLGGREIVDELAAHLNLIQNES